MWLWQDVVLVLALVILGFLVNGLLVCTLRERWRAEQRVELDDDRHVQQ